MSNDKSQILPKTERTPKKWYEAKMGNDHQGLIVDEVTGENIAVIYKKENAAFIVKACNLHDELVEALEYFVELIENDIDTKIIKLTSDGALAQATALLSKIKGA